MLMYLYLDLCQIQRRRPRKTFQSFTEIDYTITTWQLRALRLAFEVNLREIHLTVRLLKKLITKANYLPIRIACTYLMFWNAFEYFSTVYMEPWKRL